MSFISLAAGVGEAIRDCLAQEGLQGALRIALCFVGCCDPSLGLTLDVAREGDLVRLVEGLTFVVSPSTYELTGDVTISSAADGERDTFVLVSDRPVSEWAGFTACRIRWGERGTSA